MTNCLVCGKEIEEKYGWCSFAGSPSIKQLTEIFRHQRILDKTCNECLMKEWKRRNFPVSSGTKEEEIK